MNPIWSLYYEEFDYSLPNHEQNWSSLDNRLWQTGWHWPFAHTPQCIWNTSKDGHSNDKRVSGSSENSPKNWVIFHSQALCEHVCNLNRSNSCQIGMKGCVLTSYMFRVICSVLCCCLQILCLKILQKCTCLGHSDRGLNKLGLKIHHHCLGCQIQCLYLLRVQISVR